MKQSRWLQAAAAAFLAAGLVGAAKADLPAVGKTAPAWSGKTVDGKTVGSAQLKGKVVLLNFFNNY